VTILKDGAGDRGRARRLAWIKEWLRLPFVANFRGQCTGEAQRTAHSPPVLCARAPERGKASYRYYVLRAVSEGCDGHGDWTSAMRGVSFRECIFFYVLG
jgi:hypothetical protein